MYNENRGKTCKVKNCKNNARVKGLCNIHYEETYINREYVNGKRLNLRNLVIEK